MTEYKEVAEEIDIINAQRGEAPIRVRAQALLPHGYELLYLPGPSILILRMPESATEEDVEPSIGLLKNISIAVNKAG